MREWKGHEIFTWNIIFQIFRNICRFCFCHWLLGVGCATLGGCCGFLLFCLGLNSQPGVCRSRWKGKKKILGKTKHVRGNGFTRSHVLFQDCTVNSNIQCNGYRHYLLKTLATVHWANVQAIEYSWRFQAPDSFAFWFVWQPVWLNVPSPLKGEGWLNRGVHQVIRLRGLMWEQGFRKEGGTAQLR